MKCIICRNEKNEDLFSDEHVIPDSLGGYYHIYNVCVDCNSSMGKNIDAPLVNHKLSELYRFSQNIAGKSGKIPNPFNGILNQKGNPERKARLDISSNGKLVIYQSPEVNWNEKDGKLFLTISVDCKDEGKIEQIVSKCLARKNIPLEAIEKGERTVQIDSTPFMGRWSLDLNKFKIGLLKIAYEFAIDILPSYLEDEKALCIAEILHKAKYEEVLEYVKIGNGLQHEIWKPFSHFLDLDSRSHYLTLTNDKVLGLICLIKLHDLFAVGVILSQKSYLKSGEFYVGINSLNQHNFIKLTGEEMVKKCLGPRHTRPCYYLDYKNKDQAIAEINASDFRYYGYQDEVIPLYTNQNQFICYIDDVLKESKVENKYRGNKFIHTFWFNPNIGYHVKAIKTGNLYRIIGYEIEQEIIRKI